MREILFRGKRVDNWEWVEGDFANIAVPSLGLAIRTDCDEAFAEDTTPCIITTKARQHPYFSNAEPYCIVENEYFPVDPSTIGQFTGLTDKHEKQIFEGDVVRDEMDGVGVVEYNDGAYIVEYKKPIMTEWSGTLLFAEEPKELIVLGNIHDNPELLP